MTSSSVLLLVHCCFSIVGTLLLTVEELLLVDCTTPTYKQTDFSRTQLADKEVSIISYSISNKTLTSTIDVL